MLADQVLGAAVARQRHHFGKEAPCPQDRVAPLAGHRRDADGATFDRAEGCNQAVEQVRADARHVAQLDDGCVSIGTERADSGSHRGAEALGEIRVGDKAQSRPAGDGKFDRRPDLICHMAEHDNYFDGLGLERRLHGMHDERRAVGISQHFVGAAHACRTTGGQHENRNPWCLVRSLAFHRLVVARLRAARDFSQQPTRAHADDFGAPHLQTCGQPFQDHVEAIVLGGFGTSRQAEDRPAVELGGQQQVAGIHRHAEVMNLAARLGDAQRHHVVAVDDGRGAGDQEEIAPVRLQFLQRGRDGFGVVGNAAFASQGAAKRRKPLGRRADRLVQNLVARARQLRL